MTAFHSARLKLTLWYLLIIMAICTIFSIIIFRALTLEVDRFERAQRFLIERRLREGNFHFMPPPTDGRVFIFSADDPLNPELIAETKQRILLMIIAANLGILTIAGGLGYFLAGRTLRPIQDMIDEQNRFITDASHELKTPLTALRSEFEVALLDEEKLDSHESKQLIKSGLEEIMSLQKLAENLLTLTHQQKKSHFQIPQKVSLLEIVELAIKKIIPLAKKKHISINNLIDDFMINGDTQSLTELFVILLDNAIKYSTDHDKVTLRTKKIDGRVQIEVKDIGNGISKKDLPHIFKRFYRADTSRSRSSGYGLGLSIAQQIVKMHDGTISVESTVRKGTKFTISLPLASE